MNEGSAGVRTVIVLLFTGNDWQSLQGRIQRVSLLAWDLGEGGIDGDSAIRRIRKNELHRRKRDCASLEVHFLMIQELRQVISWSLSAFTDYKLLFERSIGFSDDAVHIFVGVLIQLAAAAVLRSSIARAGPLLTVVVLELANEILDIRHEVWPSASMQLGESIKDMSLTLALPITLFVISRRASSILVSQPEASLAGDESKAGGIQGSDDQPGESAQLQDK